MGEAEGDVVDINGPAVGGTDVTGASVGIPVGLTDGIIDGERGVGRWVEALVTGALDGSAVGVAVEGVVVEGKVVVGMDVEGAFDGMPDGGVELGRDVGSAVGPSEGFRLGAPVDGIRLGCTVGTGEELVVDAVGGLSVGTAVDALEVGKDEGGCNSQNPQLALQCTAMY